MIKVEHAEVWGFEHAIRGCRNPLCSWERSDSDVCPNAYGLIDCAERHNNCPRENMSDYYDEPVFCIGDADMKLMQNLFKAGPEHRKYLRQIFASMDITAPLYWWKEMDQYKIGVTTDSCSTMHKIADKEFELSDFSCEHLTEDEPIPCTVLSGKQFLECGAINALNRSRDMYLQTKDKKWWWQMIQLLPSSYNQRRTVTMSYENVFNIIHQRTGHKLDEWRHFVGELKKLPYVKEIGGL